MQLYIVIFILFFLPLIIIPLGYSYFEVPKVFIAEFAIEILLLVTIFKRSFSFQQYNLVFIILLFCIQLLAIVHLILFPSTTNLFGNVFRLQGIFLLSHLLIFSLLSSLISIKATSSLVYWLSFAGVLGGTYFTGSNLANRSVGSLGEPNSLAATVIFLWPFLYFANSPIIRHKMAKLLLFLAVFIVLSLTSSRSGLVAFSIQMVFLLLFNQFHLSINKTSLICTVLAALSLLLPFFEKSRWFEYRPEIWETAFKAGLNQPIVGNGFGNIEHALRQASETIGNNVRFQYVDSSHNILLDWWVQGGSVGFILLISLLGLSYWRLISRQQSKRIILFLGIFVMLLFNPLSITALAALWWIVGQGFNNSHN